MLSAGPFVLAALLFGTSGSAVLNSWELVLLVAAFTDNASAVTLDVAAAENNDVPDNIVTVFDSST